jgi:hypothetical protein
MTGAVAVDTVMAEAAAATTTEKTIVKIPIASAITSPDPIIEIGLSLTARFEEVKKLVEESRGTDDDVRVDSYHDIYMVSLVQFY